MRSGKFLDESLIGCTPAGEFQRALLAPEPDAILEQLAHVPGADVVGLQESEGNARRIADLLGWAFALRFLVLGFIEPENDRRAYWISGPVWLGAACH